MAELPEESYPNPMKEDEADEMEEEELNLPSTSKDLTHEHWDMQDGRDKQFIKDTEAQNLFHSLGMSSTYEGCGINSGKLLAWSLPRDDEDFLDIQKYVSNGQEHGYKIEVQSVIRIIANADYYRDFDEPQHKGKLRMMLFHGTKKQTVVSILQNGLVLPKSWGQMFGSGVYFADRASKSVNYCGIGFPGPGAWYRGMPNPGKEGYLFLCEVLLGKMFESESARASLTAPPEGYDSVKGVGRNIPDSKEDKVVDGVVWPLGPTVPNTTISTAGYLQWNEYIVYKPTQVQPRYLIKFLQKFEEKKKKRGN